MVLEKKDEIAIARFQLISPLLDDKLDQASFLKTRREIALSRDISEKTLSRYVSSFQDKGFDGLKPSYAGRPGNRAIPPEILTEAIVLRRENPQRSVSKIIRCLELEGLIEKDSIKRSTLQQQLANSGFSKDQIKVYTDSPTSGGFRFQRKNRNLLWQADSKYGPIIGKNKTYLISFIDDCTRYVLHSQFYLKETIVTLMHAFRMAITKFGAPKGVYFDNGAPYASHALDRTCSLLTISKRHTKVRTARSKGKIEKFHQVVDKFISELRLEPVDDVDKLNMKWTHYLEAFYQRFKHEALLPDTTPLEAFYRDKTELRLISQDDLDGAFLLMARGRKVDKSGCVNFQGKKYTADGLLVLMNKKVDIVWDPFDESKVWAEYGKLTKMLIKPVVIKEWGSKRPELPSEPDRLKTDKSRFLIAAKNEYNKRNEAINAAYNGIPIENSDQISTNSEARDIIYNQNIEKNNIDNEKLQNSVILSNKYDFKCINLEKNYPQQPLDKLQSTEVEIKATKCRAISFKSIDKERN